MLMVGKMCPNLKSIWWQFPKVCIRYHECLFLLFLPLQFYSYILYSVFFFHSVCLLTCGGHVSSIYPCSSLAWKFSLCHVSLFLCSNVPPLSDSAPYNAELDSIPNCSSFKSVVFLIDIYMPWPKFYM